MYIYNIHSPFARVSYAESMALLIHGALAAVANDDNDDVKVRIFDEYL